MIRARLKHWRRLRAYRRTLAAVHAGRLRPVLVYSMGKVGSTAVQHALEAVPGLASFHVHSLAAQPARGRGHRRKLGQLLYHELVIGGVPAPVITLVREPVARNASAFFHNLRRELGDADPHQLPTATLAHHFASNYGQRLPIEWFDIELRRALGVDVYATMFDPARGYAHVAHPRHPTLVLRCELPDADKGRLIGEFLGIGPVPLRRANVAQDKTYAEAYTAFKQAVSLDAVQLDELLDSRYARHFYTVTERATARAQWRGRQT